MGETLLLGASVILDAVRTVFSWIDRPFYGLLAIMYQIFFNVSSFQFFNKAIYLFFGRVQLIIGVYMMFQLAMTILKGIIDPDTFVKNEGSSKGLVPRIIISLLMLTLIMPVHTGNSNEFEIQIGNQGLLFGTLSSLQNRIIKNNTLGKLILGISDNESNYVSADSDQEELETSSRIFSSSILKAFVRINLVPYDDRKHEEGKTDDMINDNRMCTDMSEEELEVYTRLDADPEQIFDLINSTCTTRYKPKAFWDILGVFREKAYRFTYTPILSTIAAVAFVVILFSFTLDVVIRGIKLAFLRLLAPIPIISYMDPNGSKDGAFNSWWKTLTSTYIDLFVRLSIVYFIIFIIQDLMVSGIVMNEVGGTVGAFSLILVYIGLFAFAKQAPKFIRDMLGIKGDGGGFFSGLGAVATAAGFGAAGLGTIGSMASNWRAADEEGKSLGRNPFLRNMVNAGSAIAGGIAGGYTGVKAALGKDATPASVLQAQSQRNARRAAHSTLPGRVADSMYGMVRGQSLSTQGNNRLEGAQNWVKAQGAWKSALEDEARSNGQAVQLGNARTSAGDMVSISGRFEELERAVASAHDGIVSFNGVDYDSNSFTKRFMDDALKVQVADYQKGGTRADGDSYTKLTKAGEKLYAKRQDVIKAKEDVDVSKLADEEIRAKWKAYDVDNSKTFGPAIGAANNVISDEQNNMRQVMRRANNQQANKK